MVEAVILLCGGLVIGGIAKACCSKQSYSEEYYRYLRNNKEAPKHIDTEKDYYRYLG